MAFPEFTYPDDIQADLQLFHALASGERDHYQIEKRYIRKDGQVMRGRLTVSLIQSPDAKPKFGVGMVEDITAHKLAEESLRENQRVLATLLSNLPGMVYRGRNDADRTMEFVSEGCRDLVGYAPEDLMDNRKVALGKLVHPDDRQFVWDTVQAVLQARKPFELPYRIRTATGAEKWVWERGQGIFSRKGELLALEGFITDITPQHQAEIERREALLREQRAREEYTRQLILSEETERRRIAAELHDSLGQNLLLIKNRAQLALADKTASGDLRLQLEVISQLVLQTVGEIRQISRDLHPYHLDHLGLTRALEAMIDSAAQSSGVAIERKLDSADDVFSGDAAANLYRVVQESLNNILKHSGATWARIELERDLREVLLHVRDNGCGFDAGKANSAGGIGLRNMTERVHILGGKLKVDSQPHRGTRIEVTIPIADIE
jgi:PAS domain S-box-containing protein